MAFHTINFKVNVQPPWSDFCGSGGSRTLVRTRKPYAFYTLIPAFGFRATARPGPPTAALSPNFHLHIGAWTDYFRFNLRRLIFGFGTTSSERRLVPLPSSGIKPVIYYTSIRQREHTHCCQLIFWPNVLRSLQPSLRVLTYHLNLLSNPVNPMMACKKRCKFMVFSNTIQLFQRFFT